MLAIPVTAADVALNRSLLAKNPGTVSVADERPDSTLSNQEFERSRTNVRLPLAHIENVLIGGNNRGEPLVGKHRSLRSQFRMARG